MRRRLLILLMVCFCGSQIHAQTNGTLTVSVATSSTGGNYAPRNILAIWIEDFNGKFVKTLLAYANTRITHLNTWQSSTLAVGKEFYKTDAITGATQSNHGSRTCTWNGTDYNNQIASDGNYKVRMELTDKNSTGNVASFTITKGPNVQKLTPANVPSFSSISLNWATSATQISPEITGNNMLVVSPNPGTGLFSVLGNNILSLRVINLAGNVICESQTPTFDLTGCPKGIYLVTIKTDQATLVKKIIKE